MAVFKISNGFLKFMVRTEWFFNKQAQTRGKLNQTDRYSYAQIWSRPNTSSV